MRASRLLQLLILKLKPRSPVNHTTPQHALQAFCVAVILPSIGFAGVVGEPTMAILVGVVSALHALVLGWPAYWLLKRFAWVNGVTLSLAGALVAALPVGAMMYPAGAGTDVEWNSFYATVLMFGFIGAVSGGLFCLVLWWRGRAVKS
jgi:hypothetical protein